MDKDASQPPERTPAGLIRQEKIIDISDDDDCHMINNNVPCPNAGSSVQIKIEDTGSEPKLKSLPQVLIKQELETSTDMIDREVARIETPSLSPAVVTSVSTAATPLLCSTLFTEDANVASDVGTSVPVSSSTTEIAKPQSKDMSRCESPILSVTSVSTLPAAFTESSLHEVIKAEDEVNVSSAAEAIRQKQARTESPSLATSLLFASRSGTHVNVARPQSPDAISIASTSTFASPPFGSSWAAQFAEDDAAPTIVKKSRHLAPNFGNIAGRTNTKVATVTMRVHNNKEVVFRTQDNSLRQQDGVVELAFTQMYVTSPFTEGCPNADGVPQCTAVTWNAERKALIAITYTTHEASRLIAKAKKHCLDTSLAWCADEKVRDLVENNNFPRGSRIPCAKLELCVAQTGDPYIEATGCIECLRALALNKDNRIDGYGTMTTFKTFAGVKRISGFREDKLQMIVDTLTMSGIYICASEDNILFLAHQDACYSFESWVTNEVDPDDLSTLW